MDYVVLGKSNLLVSRTGFGAASLGKAESQEIAIKMVKKAYEEGINFFDTSKSEVESSKRLGAALAEFPAMRKNIFIAAKSAAHSADELAEDIDTCLSNLQTDYIDLFQLVRTNFLPGNEEIGLVEKLLNLKTTGVIKHYGISTDSIETALSMLTSDVDWETLQFPFNMLCGKETEQLTKEIFKADIGFIASRPLCGGIVTNIPLALGYLQQFDNVVPIWGVQTEDELQQILYFTQNPPNIDDKFNEEVEKIRQFFN